MKRYTASRKYDIMKQITKGEATAQQIMQEHLLSAEELEEWTRMFCHNGIVGLKATTIQLMEGR